MGRVVSRFLARQNGERQHSISIYSSLAATVEAEESPSGLIEHTTRRGCDGSDGCSTFLFIDLL